jgi:predicted RNA binding protein YcfA (HicA-like mRNA interferase family)
MPKLSPVSRRVLIKKLRKLGFSGPHSATRHEYMEKSAHHIFIPNPHGVDVGIPLLKRIIQQVGTDVETFLSL